MHLVLFDIDGTLVDSQAADGEIYLRALEEVFGFTHVSSNWSAYRHTTDSGILHEVFEVRLGRPPREREIAAFKSHFIAAVAATAAREGFRAVRGAGHLLCGLTALTSHGIGLATGGWRESARCKMSSAGLRFDAYPSACADDAQPRAQIMQLAIARAEAALGLHRLASVAYVGDGLWDARACRSLGIPFIGIANPGADADRLLAEGAATVLEDFSNLEALCAALPGRPAADELSAAAAG